MQRSAHHLLLRSIGLANHARAPLPLGRCALSIISLALAPCAIPYACDDHILSPSKPKLLPLAPLIHSLKSRQLPSLRCDTQSSSLPRLKLFVSAFDTRPRFESAVTPPLITNPERQNFSPSKPNTRPNSRHHVCRPGSHHYHHRRSSRRSRTTAPRSSQRYGRGWPCRHVVYVEHTSDNAEPRCRRADMSRWRRITAFLSPSP